MTPDELTQIMGAVSKLSDTVKNNSEHTDSELTAMRDKFKVDLDSINGRIKDMQFIEPVMEGKDIADKDSKITVPVKEHADAFRSRMYNPRSHWKRIGGYKMTGTYDGLEHIMDMNDNVVMCGLIMQYQKYGHKNPNTPQFKGIVKGLKSYSLLMSEIRGNSELAKALDTATSGEGSEFIPTQFSARMIDDIRLQLRVGSLFRHLSLTKSPYTNPVQQTRMTSYLVGESTSDSGTKISAAEPGTGNVTWTAIKFGVRTLWSDDLDEDSIIQIMPWVRDESIQSMADAEEDCLVNGDTSGTHMDSNVTTSTDRRKGYKGLRYFGYDSGSGYAYVDLSTLNIANLRSLRKKMGRFGVNPANLAWICSINSFMDLLGLDEVKTIDKYGNFATVITGELAKLDGIPVVVSEFVPTGLNASGVYDGATTTKTGLILPYRPSFIVADFGTPKTETDRDIETQQTKLVSTRRQDMQRVHTPSATEQNCGYGYNIAS